MAGRQQTTPTQHSRSKDDTHHPAKAKVKFPLQDRFFSEQNKHLKQKFDLSPLHRLCWRHSTQENVNGKTVCVGIQRLGAQEYGGGLVIAHVRHDHDQRVDRGVEADDLWEQVFDKLAVCGKHSHCYVEVTDVVIGIFTKHEHCEVLLFQTVLVQMLHCVVRHVCHLHLRDVEHAEGFAQ